MARLGKLGQMAASAQRIEPLDPRLLQLPPVVQPAPGDLPPVIQQVIATYVAIIGQSLEQLGTYSARLKALYATQNLAPAPVPA